jgi:hypothetical protein
MDSASADCHLSWSVLKDTFIFLVESVNHIIVSPAAVVQSSTSKHIVIVCHWQSCSLCTDCMDWFWIWHSPESWWICDSTVGLQPLYHIGHSGTVPVTISSLSYQSSCRICRHWEQSELGHPLGLHESWWLSYPFVFYPCLNKCIWDIDDCDIPFFLGINDAQ